MEEKAAEDAIEAAKAEEETKAQTKVQSVKTTPQENTKVVKAKGKGKSSQNATKGEIGSKDKPVAASKSEAAAEAAQESAPPTKTKPKSKSVVDAAMIQRYFDGKLFSISLICS